METSLDHIPLTVLQLESKLREKMESWISQNINSTKIVWLKMKHVQNSVNIGDSEKCLLLKQNESNFVQNYFDIV
jgi:hypothetical protein